MGQQLLPDKAESERDGSTGMEESGKETAAPFHGLLWGLISMPRKVTAGNLLNTTAICLTCSKGTNEKVYKLKSTSNLKTIPFKYFKVRGLEERAE